LPGFLASHPVFRKCPKGKVVAKYQLFSPSSSFSRIFLFKSEFSL
jgi:hypothetical protein